MLTGDVPMISLINASKTYQGSEQAAISDVSLEVPRGQFCFLIGHAGAGKSTLLLVLLLEERLSGGRLLLDGRDVTKLRASRAAAMRRSVGFVLQDSRLLPGNVFDNVHFAARAAGRARSAHAAEVTKALAFVGMAEMATEIPWNLSPFDQKRVEIARALVNSPKFLLADEPTGQLDISEALKIVRILDRISRSGVTVFFATRDADIAQAARRRVIEMQSGCVVSDRPGIATF